MKTAVLLSSLVVLVLAGDECPPDELIAPCTCEKIGRRRQAVTCSNVTDVATLDAIFEKSGDWPIKDFVLEYSNISSVPAAAVVRKDFWRLTVRNSTLDSLFDGAPTSDNNLLGINLSGVKFRRGILWDRMTSLENLHYFTIESSELPNLGRDFREHVPAHLKTFQTAGTQTSSLDDRAFVRMKEMITLQFRNSRIATLKRSMLANPSTFLNSFDFSYNRIETLPDDMFHGMPRLRGILLAGNRIKHFSESVFGGRLYDELLMAIFLQENPIACDCTIRWYVSKKRKIPVNARCAGPEDKKGLSVTELKPAWYNHCLKSNTLLDAIE